MVERGAGSVLRMLGPVNLYLRANFPCHSLVSDSHQNVVSSLAIARPYSGGTFSPEFMLKMGHGKGTLRLVQNNL